MLEGKVTETIQYFDNDGNPVKRADADFCPVTDYDTAGNAVSTREAWINDPDAAVDEDDE
jgi:hypothetical protein